MNVYSQPEAFGLTPVAELENGGGYDFDTIVVWRQDTTGKLFWAHDAGCSCPIPFEEYQGLPDLSEFDVEAIRRRVRETASYGASTAEERTAFMRKIEELA